VNKAMIDHDVQHARADHHCDADGEQQVRERHGRLGQPVDNTVDPSAEVAGEEPREIPMMSREGGRSCRDEEGECARRTAHGREICAPKRVGPEDEQRAVGSWVTPLSA